MRQTARQILDSPAFKRMVARQWAVSVILAAALFAIYYGFVVLVAVGHPLLARKVGESTPLGIVLGVAVIVLSWVLTGIYVAWANGAHDARVRDLRNQVR